MAEEMLLVAKIARPHGVRGDLVLTPINAQLMGALEVADTVHLGTPPTAYTVIAARIHRGRWLLRVEGCEDRNAAETLRSAEVRLMVDLSEPPTTGQYYHHQLVGLNVQSETGEALGTLKEILITGANDVYVVRDAQGKELLLPAIESVVLNVDLAAQQMTVHLLEGLRE